MAPMEKTVKIRAYPDDAKSNASQGNLADGQNISLELAMKNAQLEEEKSRSLEHLKTIVQLRESLKQEQAKTAEMARKMAEQDAKAKDLAALEANELARKNAQREEEKRKSLDLMKTIEQLRESLRQEQAKTAGMADKMAAQDAKARESAVLEAKIKELTEALSKIAAIAAAGEVG